MISGPCICVRLSRSGLAVESKMNLTWVAGADPRIFNIRLCRGGQSTVFRHQRLCSLCLMCSRAGQTASRCSRVPLTPSQVQSDDRLVDVHSSAGACCQYSVTFSFTSLLNLLLGTTVWKKPGGCGRPYRRQMSLTW